MTNYFEYPIPESDDGIVRLMGDISEMGKPSLPWVIQWTKLAGKDIDPVWFAWRGSTDPHAMIALLAWATETHMDHVEVRGPIHKGVDSGKLVIDIAGRTFRERGSNGPLIGAVTEDSRPTIRRPRRRWLGNAAVSADRLHALVLRLPTLSEILEKATAGNRRQPTRA